MSLDSHVDRKTYIVHATPLIKECANKIPEWNTSRGLLQVLDPYTVRLHPDGNGPYHVWANIPDTVCGGFIDFEVTTNGRNGSDSAGRRNGRRKGKR